MAECGYRKTIEDGIKVADLSIYEEDKIWARYSQDKVDIGEELARVIRTLHKAFPLTKAMRALSIGSSAEPQFRILETAFRGGLYLLDVNAEAISAVEERIGRQRTDHVVAIRGDYTKCFLDPASARAFLRTRLGGERVDLITFHHSLYYCREDKWHTILRNLYAEILAPRGAIHAVLMASQSSDRHTTTWLYNHFVGKFFNCRNDQDLCRFAGELGRDPLFKKSEILSQTNRVRFFVDDFVKFMAVVWMILLYPDVHQYSVSQREEVARFVYSTFWRTKRPLVQMQDHLVVYRGLDVKGLV